MPRINITIYRCSFQILVALFFVLIPILNRSRYSMVYGNFLSFHVFGVPLADPLAVLQLTTKNLNWPTLDNFIGTLLPLMLAYYLGTVFCSWICPYGLFSEMVQGLRRWVLPKGSAAVIFAGSGFPFKLALFVTGFFVFFIFSTTPVLNQLSAPAWYARFFQYYYGQDVVSLCYLFLIGLLLLEFWAGARLWCRYVCPQSILISLTKMLNGNRLKVIFAKEKCICKPGYERCETACTLALDPKVKSVRVEAECSNCADCIVVCDKMGKALSFKFGSDQSTVWSLASRLPRLPKLSKLIRIYLPLSLFFALLVLILWDLPDLQFKAGGQKINHPLLADKKISWADDQADHFELLGNGTFICVGGDWPVTGFKGWRWEPVDKSGSFRVILDDRRPEIYTIFHMASKMGAEARFRLEHSQGGIGVGDEKAEYVIEIYESVVDSHERTAVSMDSRALLFRYAAETYVYQLEVQDYHGLLKKVPVSGEVISTEVMLTTARQWLNSPQIIVTEGEVAKLPIHAKLELIFHSGVIEKAEFVTSRVIDRSLEHFEDPWF